VIPARELSGIIDNIGLPYSGLNLSYSTSAPVGPGDADIMVSLGEDHRPTADYIHDLRMTLPGRFPGVGFSFVPADIVGKITAPFDGVVTARNTEIGALIESGNNAKELFHVAAVHRLRVFVNVPEIYSRAARPGMKADLTLTEFPGRPVAGTLARTAQSIDVASRTLLTEIDVDNPTGELLPGSYAEVHLKLPTEASTFKLPANAVILRTEGVRVALVRAGGEVMLQPVTLGRDYGNSLEVVAGLTGDEQVIVNAPDSIENGQKVRVAGAARP
jgi:RND family efflux transporter MFP subunit